MEEPGEECTVVFALIVKQDRLVSVFGAGGGETPCWEIERK
jgi:hypothetical protein